MRIGIIADIHEDVPLLRAALRVLAEQSVEPWLNPYKLEDLWRDPYQFTIEEHVKRSFLGRPERVLFYGHIHCWRIATPAGIVSWEGDHIYLHRPERYLVTVAQLSNGISSAIHRGHFALYDTEAQRLMRFRVVR